MGIHTRPRAWQVERVASDGGRDEHIPLPGELRSSERGRLAGREGFDTVAALYDSFRPGYPAALFADLAAGCSLGQQTRVLEVGCGSGQATRDLATYGCEIECIELGPELGELARRNLEPFPRVRVTVGAFEDVAVEASVFDLVFAATAFHWIDPSVAFPKAAQALRPGGFLALATNIHVAGGTQELVSEEIQLAHQRFAAEIGSWEFPTAEDVSARALAGGDISHVWSRLDRRFAEAFDVSGDFDPPEVSTYPWIAKYDRDQYLGMLATQSPYFLIDADERDRLFEDLGVLIDARLGGQITKQYLAVLGFARRTGDGRS